MSSLLFVFFFVIQLKRRRAASRPHNLHSEAARRIRPPLPHPFVYVR